MGDDLDLYGDLLPSSASRSKAGTQVAAGADALPGSGLLALPAAPVQMTPPPGLPPAAGQTAARQPLDTPARGGSQFQGLDYQDWDYEAGSLVVDGGEVIKSNTAGQSPAKPQDFDSLREELLADEKRVLPARAAREDSAEAVDQDAETASDSEADGAQDAAIQLGEVKVSEVGSVPFVPSRRRQQAKGDEVAVSGSGKMRTKHVAMLLGPPPPTASSADRSPQCLVLVGGLPWWLTDAELRRLAENFGPVRCIRVLDHAKSGRSAGIALIEFTIPEAARRAAAPAEGLSRLPAWCVMKVPPPRLVMVSGELFSRLNTGALPWPDGGCCADDLRDILFRQFSQAQKSGAARRSRSPRGRRQEPLRRNNSSGSFGGGALQRQHSSASFGGSAGPVQRQQSRGSFGRGPSPEPSPPPSKDEGSWADKLKLLKGNVNRKDGTAVRPSAEEAAAFEAARRGMTRR